MSRTAQIEPWQVWWADLDPTQGHEQAKKRPVVIVSSAFHLALTGGKLVTVLPLTTVERRGWDHHVPITSGLRDGWAMTEQTRTISATRLLNGAPVWSLSQDEIVEVRGILAVMIDL